MSRTASMQEFCAVPEPRPRVRYARIMNAILCALLLIAGGFSEQPAKTVEEMRRRERKQRGRLMVECGGFAAAGAANGEGAGQAHAGG